MNKKKALLALVCAVSLVVATFVGTMAYFTDTESVTNTFTVGKVKIDLDEKNVDQKDADGNENKDVDRDKANTYHLIPGVTYEKDPTVTIESGSEDCYVRMLVNVKNIDKLKDALDDQKYYAGTDENKVFLIQMLTGNAKGEMTWDSTDWPCVVSSYDETTDGGVTTGTYEFRYKEVVKSDTTKLDPLFTHITIPGADADNEDMKKLLGVEIVVEAHAIQAAGFDDANQAWEAFTK